MRTIVFAGSKRRAGKTTLAIELAVCAGEALILDLHPQQAATKWAERRESDWPVVRPTEPEALVDVLASARHAGLPWTFVDTWAQARPEITCAAINAADLVLIPSRPGLSELGTLRDIVELIPMHKESAIVLNGCMPYGGAIRERLLREAFLEARRYGRPVASSVVAERDAFPKAFAEGSSVIESEPDGKAAADVVGLWSWFANQADALVA